MRRHIELYPTATRLLDNLEIETREMVDLF